MTPPAPSSPEGAGRGSQNSCCTVSSTSKLSRGPWNRRRLLGFAQARARYVMARQYWLALFHHRPYITLSMANPMAPGRGCVCEGGVRVRGGG